MDYKGLGMPLPSVGHQDIVLWLYRRLLKKLPKKYRPNLCNSDRTADFIKGKGEIVPDICLFTNVRFDDGWQHEGLLFEVEVVNCKGQKSSAENIERLFGRTESLQEAFLFNYEMDEWIRYTRQDDGRFKVEHSDFSRTFRTHLSRLAKVGASIEEYRQLF